MSAPKLDELARRLFDDGRVAVVVPLTFGRARIGLVHGYRSVFFDDVW